MQLKRKFDEVQEQKERFEELLKKKVKFLEAEEDASRKPAASSKQTEKTEAIFEVDLQSGKADVNGKAAAKKPQRLASSGKHALKAAPGPVLALIFAAAVLAYVVFIPQIIAYIEDAFDKWFPQQFADRAVQHQATGIVLPEELDTPFIMLASLEQPVQPQTTAKPSKSMQPPPPPAKTLKPVKTPPAKTPKPVKTASPAKTPKPVKTAQPKKTPAAPPKAPVEIVVQLQPNPQFLPLERIACPTIENNMILRRHQARKSSNAVPQVSSLAWNQGN